MTPHEALSHALTPHQGEPWKFWTTDLPMTRVQVVHRATVDQYDLLGFHVGGGMRVAPRTERCRGVREVLTELRGWFVAESADTTAIDHALTHLQEP